MADGGGGGSGGVRLAVALCVAGRAANVCVMGQLDGLDVLAASWPAGRVTSRVARDLRYFCENS